MSRIQRIVCFKFKSGTTQSEIEKHLTDFKALKQKIPEIISYEAGPEIITPSDGPSEWDTVHVFTFEHVSDVAGYYDHPAHDQFTQKHEQYWEKVFVVNGVIE